MLQGGFQVIPEAIYFKTIPILLGTIILNQVTMRFLRNIQIIPYYQNYNLNSYTMSYSRLTALIECVIALLK